MKQLAKFTLALIAAATLFTAPARAEAAGVVNVNTAGAEQLTLLPRVGPALAGKILDHRKENGPFKEAEDLLEVSGIGDKLFSLLEPFVAVSGETTLKEKVKAGALAKSGGQSAKKETAKATGGKAKAAPAAEGAAEDGRR